MTGESKDRLLEHVSELKPDTQNPADCVADGKLLSYDSLTAETSYFWFLLCQHIRQQGVDFEDVLEQILPEMSAFCDYIQRYGKFI